MKWFNNFLEKIGIDKVLHFVVGFAIASLGFPWSYPGTIVLGFFGIILGGIKECLDETGDMKDWYTTIFGVLVAVAYSFLALWIGPLEIFLI